MSNESGYTGTGFADYDYAAGGYVEWTNVNQVTASVSTITFRYANGSSKDRPLAIYVNDKYLQDLSFPPTTYFSNWKTISLKVQLTAGVNKIKAVALISEGGPNLDYLQVVAGLSEFNFNTQAPSNFKYSLDISGVPNLGASQNVAITQGKLNVANGAASYSVAIDLPPAIRDLKPSLSLGYNSRGGNGLMGMGWGLNGLSSITRCRTNFSVEGAESQKSNPRYSNGDRLCMDGQKLVVASLTTPASDSVYWASGTEYKTEIDSFNRIVAYSSDNGSHAYLKVFTKDGRILTFGGETEGQNSRIRKPGNTASMVGTWLLDKVEDLYGNSYTITYLRDNPNGSYYPDRINFAPGSAVKFDYQTRSGQVPSGYDMGGYYQYQRLLKSVTTYIDVASPSDPTSGTAVKQYKINYKLSTGTQRDLVDTIAECGMSSGAWQCAKPLTFSWQQGEFGFEDTPVASNDTTTKQVVDLDGDGYNDLVGDTDIYWGSSLGTFQNPNPTYVSGSVPAGVRTFTQPFMTKSGYALFIGTELGTTLETRGNKVDPNQMVEIGIIYGDLRTNRSYRKLTAFNATSEMSATVADLNNDGLDDITYGGFGYYQLNDSNLSFSDAVYLDIPKGVGVPNFVDLTGDGMKDQMYTYAKYPGVATTNSYDNGVRMVLKSYSQVLINFLVNPTELFQIVYSDCYGGFRKLLSGGLHRVIADINGDGQKDYLFYHKNTDPVSASNPNGGKYEWIYRLNLQNATSEEVNTHILQPDAGGSYPANFLSLSYDWDKDGRDDLLAMAPAPDLCQLRVLLSRTIEGKLTFQELKDVNGNTYVIRKITQGEICKPFVDETSINAFRGDRNNDGIPDLWTSTGVYLGKTQQPDLMTVVTDGFGAQTKVEYSTLTGKDNNGQPLYTPDSIKPSFPQVPANRGMQVVKKLSVSNGQGGFNDRVYNYTGARSDVQGRGFLGFANIQVRDIASGVATSTDYRQSFPYIGRVDKVTVKATSGELIGETKNVYTIHSSNSRFPYVDYSLQKTYQLTTTDISNPLSATKTSNTYDMCGNLTEQVTDTGTTISGASVIGMLSHRRVANDVNYYGTAECNDDFVYRRTEETSKTSLSDDLRTTVTEFEPNAAKEIAKITAFKDTPQQLVTIINRATNGVVSGSNAAANDIDGAVTSNRVTSFSDFTKGLFPKTLTNILSSGNLVTTVGYDYRFGLENSILSPSLQSTSRVYDHLGRLVDEATDDGTHTELISFYCSSAPVSCPSGAAYGVATRVTNAKQLGKLGAPLTITYYDSLQREIRKAVYSLDGKSINTDKIYSADGRITKVSEPFIAIGGSASASNWTSYSEYDALGRPHYIEGPDGGSKRSSYEKYSSNLRVTDTVTVRSANTIDTQISSRIVNPIGQVVQVVDAVGTPVDYTYNSADQLETTRVNNNAATLISIGYDKQGNKNHLVDPDAGVIDFDYNGFGEMRRQIWQKGVAGVTKSMVLSYDQLGRQITRVDNPASGSSVTYTWEWDTKKKGLLSSESGNSQVISYDYNSQALVSGLTTTITGLGSRTVNYGYDDFGRPNSVVYPNGFTIVREYHAAGMAVKTQDITNAASPKVLWALGNDLDSRGNFNNQLWGNGVVTQAGFDNQNGQLKTIKSGRLLTDSLVGLPSDIQSLSYEYDTLGNLKSRSSKRTDNAGTPIENIREDFVYDKLNRLKTSTTSGLFARFNEYNYDELGNLTYKSSKLGSSSVNDDVGVLSYSRTNNAGVHAVTAAAGQSYYYDKYGNMTKRGNETIDYDVFNKPTRISGSSVTTIDYDANHDRYREVNGSTITYSLAGGLYEEIVEGTKVTQKNYVDGVILNSRVINNGVEASNDTLYVHTDNQGSSEAISDKLGAFVTRMSFSDWGKRQQSDWKTGSPTDGFPTQNGYTGHHEMDQHSLVHMGGRVYDPALGRFLSADLLVQSPYSSQSFNRYSYVANNPMSNVDPTGYQCDSYRGGTKQDDGSVKWSTSWTEGSGCMTDNPFYHQGGGMNYGYGTAENYKNIDQTQQEGHVDPQLICQGMCHGVDYTEHRYATDEELLPLYVAGTAVTLATPSWEVGMAKLLSSGLNLGKTTALVSEISLNPAAQRAILRAAFGTAAAGKIAHHLVPLEALKRFPELMRKAAEGGFNINGKNNGVLLKIEDHIGGHPEYNKILLERLGRIDDTMSSSKIAKEMQNIADQVRKAINEGSFGPWG